MHAVSRRQVAPKSFYVTYLDSSENSTNDSNGLKAILERGLNVLPTSRHVMVVQWTCNRHGSVQHILKSTALKTGRDHFGGPSGPMSATR